MILPSSPAPASVEKIPYKSHTDSPAIPKTPGSAIATTTAKHLDPPPQQTVATAPKFIPPRPRPPTFSLKVTPTKSPNPPAHTPPSSNSNLPLTPPTSAPSPTAPSTQAALANAPSAVNAGLRFSKSAQTTSSSRVA